jgi:hypothetical protein
MRASDDHRGEENIKWTSTDAIFNTLLHRPRVEQPLIPCHPLESMPIKRLRCDADLQACSLSGTFVLSQGLTSGLVFSSGLGPL